MIDVTDSESAMVPELTFQSIVRVTLNRIRSGII
jgi:hypothetical protein